MEFEHDIDGLFKTYQDLLPMKPEDDARLWEKFRLDWNYNSNRIEGNTLTYGETEALLILGTEPKRLEKDIREMKAHDVGITHLRNLAEDERPISEADVRELNRIILKENYFIETETAEGNISRKEVVPGTYKSMPNHVRLRGGGIHKFAEPHEVPQRMEAVVQSIQNYVSKPTNKPLAEYLSELHQDFINTHPFDDGNGRVVRMLLNYVCLKLGWPPIIIKNVKKADYLTALEQWDKGNQDLLKSLMHTELVWSLNKSIKAARGEDIEDPDDIDKEIDMFMREHAEPHGISIRTDETKIRIYSSAIIPIVEILEKRIRKFEQKFESYQANQPPSRLRSVLRSPRFLENNKFAAGFDLEGFRTDRTSFDLKSILTANFGHDSFAISFVTRSPHVTIQHDFPITSYDKTINKEAVEKYCQTIGKSLLDYVKSRTATNPPSP